MTMERQLAGFTKHSRYANRYYRFGLCNYPDALYLVKLTLNTSCTTRAQRYFVNTFKTNAGNVPNIPTQVTNNTMPTPFTLAPNPAQNYTVVNASDKSIGSQLSLTGPYRRLIKEQTITINTTTLYTTGLAAGIYLVQVTTTPATGA